MITLYQSKPAFGLPSISPFSIKLELFLKAADIDYRVSTNVSRSPKGKSPFIEYRGKFIGDSSLIIDLLVKDFELTLDAHLTAHQKAIGFMICKALEEGYYFCGLYENWKITANWLAFRDAFLADVPKIARIPIAGFFRRRLLQSLYLQGMGRHNVEEVQSIGIGYLSHLEAMLNGNDYLLGERFSTYDCTVYGFLARQLRVPVQSAITEYAHATSLFKNYCQRIETVYKIATPLA